MRTAVLICLLLIAAGAAVADDRALLIGVGRYQIPEAALPGIDEDLEMMRDVVRRLGFADSQVEVVRDSAATLDGIRGAISRWLIAGTHPGDRAVLYFTGHGTRVPDASGDEVDGSDEVLLPYDFQEIISGPGTRLTNVLLDDELGLLLEQIPAGEVVVLVDSCNSGTMTRSVGRFSSKFYTYSGLPAGSRGSLTDRSLRGRDSIILLSAAQPDEDAQTSQFGALFTQGVARAVRAAERGRTLTLEQLQRRTESFIRREVGAQKDLAHRPMLTGNRSLRSINLFLPLPEPPVEERPERPDPPAERPTGRTDLWNRLEFLVRDADQPLEVAASKETYRLGESLAISVGAAGGGYLHIFNLGDGEDQLVVLFPNPHQPHRRVRPGEWVHIPERGGFRLLAELPSGQRRQRNLVVAIETPRPLTTQSPSLADLAEAVEGSYAAGQVVVTIER